ncbi:hypothetical protein Glove_372g25 [Diversispora epigaea]|uniref:Uncharacterized protein n=1 Tax=Diversispora epigaea TaxID=1348612 RepID=A0A397H6G0_9GLOM|nr:hypothetical protein Glove_372g25 [Diversispora epigaea]
MKHMEINEFKNNKMDLLECCLKDRFHGMDEETAIIFNVKVHLERLYGQACQFKKASISIGMNCG